MDGGYGLVSGTSVAGPLVAGVFALVAEARGTFNPALLNGVVMSTAEPQSEHGKLISVIQQGGGLVRAWAAAHATTLIEPRALTFNDIDHRVGTITLQIYNSAETEMTYQLSNLAATTLYALGGDFLYNNKGVDAKADIKLSQSSITVGPRQSVTVDVSAADPQGLDPERLPLWSGWIAINGSDGQNLTIPYLGLGGSLRSTLVLDPSGLSIHGNPSQKPITENSLVIFPNPRGPQKPGPSKDKARPEGAIRHLNVTASFKLVLGSPLVRIDIVPLDLCSSGPPKPFEHVQGGDIVRLGRPVNGTSEKGPKVLVTRSLACTPDSIITEFAGVKSIGQLPGYPKEWAGIGQLSGSWTGELDAPWQFAPPGRYKFVARALSITGDAANEADWQTVESPAFSVSYEA
ncbi:subtilisin-like serine protease PR1C [Ophiocordyceps sinensis CO18]|nr:subtilisin-like serine protease PR1C [Ophiocordyceps sinensis CO18]